MSEQIMQSRIQAVSDDELKLVSFVDCGKLDIIRPTITLISQVIKPLDP